MKVRLLALFIAGATAAMPLLSQTNKTAQTSSGAGDPVPLAHVRNSFTLTVHAPYKIAAPLFGPNGERVWAGDDWDPQFIYPQPAEDRGGAVFTVKHGLHQSVWVNTLFDDKINVLEVTRFSNDLMVTVIDLKFSVLDSRNTQRSTSCMSERH
ncbi:MAG: hypothetical protein WB696_21665 [Chthoniobacterales bacterium]